LTDGVSGYRLVLPPGWHRLPADPIALRPVVRDLLLRLWADQPRDETAPRRRDLEQALVEMGDRASDQGGRELLLCLQAVAGVPLAASAVVSMVATGLQGEQGLADLAQVSAEDAISSEVLDLGSNRGVVVVRDQAVEAAERPVILGAAAEAVTRTRHVDVHLPVPDEPAMLLLSFSTPLMALGDAFSELFVAIASTLQWRQGEVWR
jgi:hypothetical protein